MTTRPRIIVAAISDTEFIAVDRAHVNRISACERCGRRYLMHDLRQRFCSRSCSANARYEAARDRMRCTGSPQAGAQ